jgi:hypothetical protein
MDIKIYNNNLSLNGKLLILNNLKIIKNLTLISHHYNLNGNLQFESMIFYSIHRGVPIIYYKNIIEMLFAKNYNLDSSPNKYQTILYEKLKKSGNKVQTVTFCQDS